MKPIDIGRDPIWKVYEGLAAEAEQDVRHYRKGPRRFRASETADCRRKLWYRLAGFIPEPKEPWLSLVSDSGNFHHDYARQLMDHYGMGLTGVTFNLDGTQDEDPYAVREFLVDDTRFAISCRPDGFIDIGLDEPAVLEIKSMTGYKHGKVEAAYKRGGNEAVLEYLREEKQSYIYQGTATAMIKEAKYVYLMLVDRNLNSLGLTTNRFGKPGTWTPLDGERVGGAVWQVEESDQEALLYKLADVTDALTEGEPPAPEYTASSNECKQCPFFVYCHGKKRNMEYPIKGVLR